MPRYLSSSSSSFHTSSLIFFHSFEGSWLVISGQKQTSPILFMLLAVRHHSQLSAFLFGHRDKKHSLLWLYTRKIWCSDQPINHWVTMHIRPVLNNTLKLLDNKWTKTLKSDKDEHFPNSTKQLQTVGFSAQLLHSCIFQSPGTNYKI